MKQFSQQNIASGLSLRKNFSWAFVGNAFYAACQWGMLILLAKIGSPEDVGLFSLGLALTAPVLMFTNLNLRAVQVTDAKNMFSFREYLGVKISTTILAMIVIISITILGDYSWETSLVILAVGVAKSIESISGSFYGFLQRHGRMDYISKSMIIKGSTSLVTLGIVVYKTGSVFWGVMSLALTWAVILTIYDRRRCSVVLRRHTQKEINPIALKKQLLPSWDWKALAKLIWLALPLGFVMMFLSLSSNIPRIIIERNLGQYALGIFSALAYIQVVGTTVVGALGESASPRLADYYAAENHRAFSSLLIRLLIIGILLGLAGLLIALLAGQEVLAILYREEYVEYDLFVLLMLAGGISYLDSFLGYGITAARYFRIQTVTTFLTTLIITLLCLWLIPVSGLHGAAYAILIANSFRVAFNLVITFYIVRVAQKKHTVWRSYILEQS